MALHFVVEERDEARPGDVITLTGREAHHAASVRRVRAGEQVTVTNGRGLWAEGSVARADQASVEITVESARTVPARTPRIALAQALAKGDRDEMAVQAATELGVDEVLPWQADRSVSRWQGPKAAKGRARWQTIVREAAKQAHRAWIPPVAEVCATRDLTALATGRRVLVLDPRASGRLSALETDARDILLVVGPEGGIAPEEIDALVAAGAEPVRLGEDVLRTSTAGPAALALVNRALGRW